LFVAIAIDLILNVLILVFRLHVWDSLVGDEFLFGDVGLVELLHPSIPSHGHGFTLLLLLWRRVVGRRTSMTAAMALAFVSVAVNLLFKPS